MDNNGNSNRLVLILGWVVLVMLVALIIFGGFIGSEPEPEGFSADDVALGNKTQSAEVIYTDPNNGEVVTDNPEIEAEGETGEIYILGQRELISQGLTRPQLDALLFSFYEMRDVGVVAFENEVSIATDTISFTPGTPANRWQFTVTLDRDLVYTALLDTTGFSTGKLTLIRNNTTVYEGVEIDTVDQHGDADRV